MGATDNNWSTAGVAPGLRAYHFGILLARFLESVLPIPLLRVVLWPAVAVSASRRAFSLRKQDWKSSKLPEDFRCKGWNLLFLFRTCQGFYLRQILTCFPDRLAEHRWQARLRWEGSDEVLALVREKRPLMLATLHYGHIDLLRAFLISRGIDTAMVVSRGSRNIISLRIKDSFLNRKRPSRSVSRDLIAKDAVQNLRYLSDGHAVLMAVDAKSDSPLNVPAPNGSLTMAVGAIQMARLAKAALVPCLLQEEKPWRFVMHVGSPVPLDDTDGGPSNGRCFHSL